MDFFYLRHELQIEIKQLPPSKSGGLNRGVRLWQAKSLRVPAIKCRHRSRDKAIRLCRARLRLMGL